MTQPESLLARSDDSYRRFLAAKAVRAPERGLSYVPKLAGHLFPFQREVTEFALRVGSAGVFLGTGLGKTLIELEWCEKAREATNGRALILTPLAVARQIEAEGRRFGYDTRAIRSQEDAGDGINVCNYDRLDKLDAGSFGAVALDESSILKAFDGATSRTLTERFHGHRFRLSATATPAPNDHVELAQQSGFLGIMGRDEMLVRWFINDASDTKAWRLKRHGVAAFWDWVASWARMAEHPRDLGDDVAGFDLSPLRIHRHAAESSEIAVPEGSLFAVTEVSATDLHTLKRATAESRARVASRLVHDEPLEPWLVWLDTDYEAEAVMEALGDAPGGVVEVRGSHPIERKEASIAAFLDGSKRVLVTKPSVAGWGLNLQFCARMIFVGRSFSYELWHQAVRRCYRFGQTRPVDVHLIVAEGEDHIGAVIAKKTDANDAMRREMVAAMKRAAGREARIKADYVPRHSGRLPAWLMEHK